MLRSRYGKIIRVPYLKRYLQNGRVTYEVYNFYDFKMCSLKVVKENQAYPENLRKYFAKCFFKHVLGFCFIIIFLQGNLNENPMSLNSHGKQKIFAKRKCVA